MAGKRLVGKSGKFSDSVCAVRGCGLVVTDRISAVADEGLARNRHAWPDGFNIEGRKPYVDFFTVPLCTPHFIGGSRKQGVQMAAQRIACDRLHARQEQGEEGLPTIIRVGERMVPRK